MVAGRRSAKTSALRCKLITSALEHEDGLVGYVAPSLTQAKRIFWVPLMRDLRQPGAEALVDKINHAEHYVRFTNGCYLRMYSAEPRAVEGIRGDGFNVLATDESDDPRFTAYVYNEIIHPALSDKEGQLIQVGTPKGRGRLYKEFLKGQKNSAEFDPTCSSVQVTAYQAGILNRTEIERARRLLPARSFRQEYLASFEAPSGLVYDEWNEQVHVVDESKFPDRFDDIIVGGDWGTANRGAMLVIGLDQVWIPPARGMAGWLAARAWIIEEHSHAGKGYDDAGWWGIAREIQRKWQPSAWYFDPAGGQDGYLRQLRNALDGGGSAAVYAANNQVGPGIGTVREFMHHDVALGEAPRLFVNRSCKWFIQEAGNYRYMSHPRIEDEYIDQVVKVDDHCQDATRYALFSHFTSERGRRRNMH